MSRAITTRPRASGRRISRALLVVLAAGLFSLGTGVATAGTPIKTGKYNGKTSQSAVAAGFRKLQFTVKKGKVTLVTEPTVARQYCVSAPVFTLEGSISKKLSRNRSFTFSKTFLGNKFDKIHGRFVSSNEIDGYALYHFQGQDLCSAGKMKVSFTAKHK